jgi:hypothetical protein
MRNQGEIMIHNPRTTGRFLPITLGCVALLVALGTYSAHAQTAKPATDPQLDQLRQQVATLERRIVELEKVKGGVLHGGTITDAARAKTLEERLASLERALESKNADWSKAGAQTVRAPFVVVDENGKTLFRVDLAPGSNRARVAVGDPTGLHVHLGQNVEGGATVAIMNNATDGNLYLIGSPRNSYIGIKNKERLIDLGTDTDRAIMRILNGSGNPIITLRGENNGIFELGNQAGTTLVSAGVTPEGTGAVSAGPAAAPTGPGIPPSFIRGVKKK